MDELLSGYEKPEDLLDDVGLSRRLKKPLIERALGAELIVHLGYEKGDPAGRGTGNIRYGYSKKTELRAAVGLGGRDPVLRCSLSSGRPKAGPVGRPNSLSVRGA